MSPEDRFKAGLTKWRPRKGRKSAATSAAGAAPESQFKKRKGGKMSEEERLKRNAYAREWRLRTGRTSSTRGYDF